MNIIILINCSIFSVFIPAEHFNLFIFFFFCTSNKNLYFCPSNIMHKTPLFVKSLCKIHFSQSLHERLRNSY